MRAHGTSLFFHLSYNWVLKNLVLRAGLDRIEHSAWRVAKKKWTVNGKRWTLAKSVHDRSTVHCFPHALRSALSASRQRDSPKLGLLSLASLDMSCSILTEYRCGFCRYTAEVSEQWEMRDEQWRVITEKFPVKPSDFGRWCCLFPWAVYWCRSNLSPTFSQTLLQFCPTL